jgi:uncharacterized protein YgiM (DUF1202 family)
LVARCARILYVRLQLNLGVRSPQGANLFTIAMRVSPSREGLFYTLSRSWARPPILARRIRCNLRLTLLLCVACSGPRRVERVAHSDSVFVRDRRGVDYTSAALATVHAGDSVEVISEEPGKQYLYWHVRLSDGRDGVMVWNPETFPPSASAR